MILAEYRRYMKVFSEKESHRLPEHKPWNHTIELKEGALEVIHACIFPMSQPKDKELGRFLDNRIHHSIQVTDSISSLLRQEKGEEAPLRAGLQEA